MKWFTQAWWVQLWRTLNRDTSWYPPEAAEAPADPVDEHFKSAPRVVAGSDIDLSKLVAEMQAAYLDYRHGKDVFAGAMHEPPP